MSDLFKEIVSGVVDAALKEVLKKTGVRRPRPGARAGRRRARRPPAGSSAISSRRC
jgi:hypothetical protein